MMGQSETGVPNPRFTRRRWQSHWDPPARSLDGPKPLGPNAGWQPAFRQPGFCPFLMGHRGRVWRPCTPHLAMPRAAGFGHLADGQIYRRHPWPLLGTKGPPGVSCWQHDTLSRPFGAPPAALDPPQGPPAAALGRLLEYHVGNMILSRAHLARRGRLGHPPKGRLRRPSCVQGWHWQTVHRTNVVATVELPYIWQLRSASHPLAVCFERAFPPSLVRGSPFGDHRSHSHTA